MEPSVDGVTLDNVSDIYKIIMVNTIFESLLFKDFGFNIRTMRNIVSLILALALPIGFIVLHTLSLKPKFADAMFQVSMITHSVCLLIRIATIIIYRKEILDLISVNFREFNSNQKRPHYSLNILKDVYVNFKKLDKFMRGNFLFLVLTWYFIPAIMSKSFLGLLQGRNGIEEVLGALPSTFPQEHTSVTRHVFSWSYHIVLALVFISIWVTMNVLCFGVTILLKKQYQILKNSLGRRHRGTDCREPLDLKGFVQDHVKLIRMTHMLRDILGPIVGAQMMQTIFITACATYVIAKPTAKSEYEVNFLAYSTMSLLELLALCWQSHVANQANENLGIGICHFSLTEPLGKNNRDWFLPLMMSQKTIKYKALGLVEINMETFLAVLRASYSYYTLIQAKA